MPVLAITSFQTYAGQLISEHLPEHQRTSANHAVTARLTRLTGRLKDKENYFGQAGRNMYEDVSLPHKHLPRIQHWLVAHDADELDDLLAGTLSEAYTTLHRGRQVWPDRTAQNCMPKLSCSLQIIDEFIGVFKESLGLKRSSKLTAVKEGILFDIKYAATASPGVACDKEPALTKLFKDRYIKDKVIS